MNWKKKPYATYGLISLNLVFFLLEIKNGGSENIDTLYRLGGLVATEVWQGAWWRLITANFLHFGWIHLLSNMLGLYFIGTIVEFSLGVSRYLIAYFASGILAMFLFSFLALQVGYSQQILVGASAAIMGMIGVIAAIYFQILHKEKTRIAARRLRWVFLIVGLQFSLDFLNPRVSLLSHLLGFVVGFFVGVFMLLFWYFSDK